MGPMHAAHHNRPPRASLLHAIMASFKAAQCAASSSSLAISGARGEVPAAAAAVARLQAS